MKTATLPLFLSLLCSFSPPCALVSGSMPGVYNMVSQMVTSGSETETYNSHQLKIYTDHFMMYANVNLQDSSASFGIGTYTENGNKVNEHVLFSAAGSNSDDTARNYTLNIEKTANGYRQVIPNIDGAGKYTLTEEYQTVNNGESTSPLDGLWKQTKIYNVLNGMDTLPADGTVTQYKAYFGGHFIWGHFIASGNEKQTNIGFGTFEMTGNNDVKEMVEESSYSNIKGQSFPIKIVILSPDSFRQSIQYNDSISGVEEYQRVTSM